MNDDRSMSTSGLDLDAGLRDLGTVLAAPAPASSLAERVRARLEAERPRRAAVPWWLTIRGRERGGREGGGHAPRLGRSLLLAAAAILLIAAAVTAAIGYGLPGIRILFGPPPSIAPSQSAPASGAPGAPGATLGLGTPVSLDEARELVDFEIVLPDGAGIGPPDAVYLAGDRLALAWGPDPALPGTAHEGLGLLLVEIDARIDGERIEKLIHSGTLVEAVEVDGAPGYWLAGERHLLAYIGPDGTPIEDSIRAVGNTLLWTRDGVTYRLEGELTRDRALALAETIR
jgi:hypothetical protein